MQSAPLSAGGLRVQIPSGPPFSSECSSVFRARGLGPRGRGRKSHHSDHFNAAVAELSRHLSSKQIYVGEIPASSALNCEFRIVNCDLSGSCALC
jgi:hypothetical protein